MERPDHRGRLPPDGVSAFVTECRTDESMGHAIQRSVAAVKDMRPSELDPLYETVEPDAIESLLGHADDRGTPVQIRVSVDGVTLHVYEDGVIHVTPDDRYHD